ncbi:MAG: hypothetical protein H0W48_03615 [Methylibium sp.]|nr:hypothetical protein [Methylibium sp.]
MNHEGHGIPLVLKSLNAVYHLARRAGEADLHLPGCPHGESPDFTAAFGAPNGAFVQSGERLVVDLGRLLQFQQGGGTGGGRKQPNFSTQMLSLLWLVPVRAGLHVALPGASERTWWSAYQSTMCSIDVKTKNGIFDLESMVLFPHTAQPNGKQANYRKLCAAIERGTFILMAFQVPVQLPVYVPQAEDGDRATEPSLNFADIFNVPVWSRQAAFERKFIGVFNHAYMRSKAGHPVIAFGYGTPQAFGRNGKSATIRQLAYLPLERHLAPVPTSKHVAKSDEAASKKLTYTALPGEDPLLAEAILLAAHRRQHIAAHRKV